MGQAGQCDGVTWGYGSRGSPDRASHSSRCEAEEVVAQSTVGGDGAFEVLGLVVELGVTVDSRGKADAQGLSSP